jgi:hypothetical protein
VAAAFASRAVSSDELTLFARNMMSSPSMISVPDTCARRVPGWLDTDQISVTTAAQIYPLGNFYCRRVVYREHKKNPHFF